VGRRVGGRVGVCVWREGGRGRAEEERLSARRADLHVLHLSLSVCAEEGGGGGAPGDAW
jgi:hypothetical protein